MCSSNCQCGDQPAASTSCSCGGLGGARGGVHIRVALKSDAALLFALISDLAENEPLGHECVSTPEQIAEHLFCATPRATALLASCGGEAVGFAVWFYTFSTFAGTPGLFVEDLYVRPAFRQRGVGRKLFETLQNTARAHGCDRLEWRALTSNAPALAFYESLGAKSLSDSLTFRLDTAAHPVRSRT